MKLITYSTAQHSTHSMCMHTLPNVHWKKIHICRNPWTKWPTKLKATIYFIWKVEIFYFQSKLEVNLNYQNVKLPNCDRIITLWNFLNFCPQFFLKCAFCLCKVKKKIDKSWTWYIIELLTACKHKLCYLKRGIRLMNHVLYWRAFQSLEVCRAIV